MTALSDSPIDTDAHDIARGIRTLGGAAFASDENPNERRSRDPVALLGRRMDRECRNAIDSLQIAAHLEAAGFSDRAVSTRYKVPDVFALADMLFRSVPRFATSAREPEKTSSSEKISLILRGILYALPGGLSLLLLPSAARNSDDARVLALSLMLGWSTGQAIANLGYRKLNDGQKESARRALRLASAGTFLVSVILLAAAVVTRPVSGVAAGLALGQVVYFLAATILLTLRQEIRLLLCLVPVTIAGALEVTWGIHTYLRMILIFLSLGTAVGCAVRETNSGGGPPEARVLSLNDLVSVFPHFVLGLTYACLVAVAIFQWSTYSTGSNVLRLDLLMVPLVVSTAAGEWQLAHFRKRAEIRLFQSGSTSEFKANTVRSVFRSVGAYMSIVAGLSLISAAHLELTGSVTAVDVTRLVSYGILGSAFFVGLLLVAHGYVIEVIAVTTPACLILMVPTAAGMGAHDAGAFVIFGVTCATVLWVLIYFAIERLSFVSSHA